MPLIDSLRVLKISGMSQRLARQILWILAASVLAHGATSFARPPVRWDALNDVGNLGRVAAVQVSPFDSHTIVAGGDVLGVGVTHDGGAVWQQTFGFLNYEDNDITFHPTDPNTLWIGTLGGPYKSTDGGIHWTLKRTGMPPLSKTTISAPIERVIFDPNNPLVLLAVAGNHRHMGYGKVGVTRWGGVWKSVDAGENWKQIATLGDAAVGAPDDGTGAMINDIAFAAGSSSVVYACSDEFGVYRSNDAGVTWTHANHGLPSTKAWSIALHPKNPNILWAAMGAGAGVYKSTDGGANWHPSSAGMTDLTPTTVLRTIAVARSNPDTLYCAAWEGSASTYRSTDGGATWTRLVARGSHRSIVGGTGNSGILIFQRINVDSDHPNHVVGACEGMVVESWDAGQSWKDLTNFAAGGGWRGTGYSGMCGTRIAWNPFKPGQIFTLGDDEGKLERSDDFLWSWKLKGSPGLIGPYNGAADVTFAADGTIYVGSGQFGNHYGRYANEPIIKSADGGNTWSYVKRPPGAVGDNRAVYVNPQNSNQLWCITGASSTGTLWKSTDAGLTWTALDLPDAGSLWNIAADPARPGTMYIGARNGIYQTTDGTHFHRIPGSPTSRNYQYAYLAPAPAPDHDHPRTPHPLTHAPPPAPVLYAVSFNSGSLGGLYRYDGPPAPDPASQERRPPDTTAPPGGRRSAAAANGSAADARSAPSLPPSSRERRPPAPHGASSGWTRLFAKPQACAVAVDPGNPRRIAVVTRGWTAFDQIVADGVWLSQDAGATWTQCNEGLRMLTGPALAFNPDGSGQLILATDGAGFYATDLGDSTPHGGTPRHLVGILAATDYDDGPQGFAPSADTRAADALHNLQPGQWVKYRVVVPATGNYAMTCCAAARSAARFHLEFNGVNTTGPLEVPADQNPGTWTDIRAPNVHLVAGEQYMKLVVESGTIDVQSVRCERDAK